MLPLHAAVSSDECSSELEEEELDAEDLYEEEAIVCGFQVELEPLEDDKHRYNVHNIHVYIRHIAEKALRVDHEWLVNFASDFLAKAYIVTFSQPVVHGSKILLRHREIARSLISFMNGTH